MPETHYDVIVIGAGSGGVRAALVSARLGARAAIIEAKHVGGTCVNLGCVPKKLMMYAAAFAEQRIDAIGNAWDVPGATFSWSTFIERKNAAIHRLNQAYEGRLADSGVTLIRGRAHFIDSHTVEVGAQALSARYIIVATGGEPTIPEIPGCQHGITSDQAFFLPALPEHITIVGGGYVAVEFASIFHGMGAKVDLLVRGDRLLTGLDHELGQYLCGAFVERGIQVHFCTELEHIGRSKAGLTLKERGKSEAYLRDIVMFATGRRARTERLGLEQVEISRDGNGSILVDAWGKTSVDNIYAIGDVTGGLALTPVAIDQGIRVAHTLFGVGPVALARDRVPTAVFSIPPLASVGLTEHEAESQGIDYVVFRSEFRTLVQTLSSRREKSLVKLVVDRNTDRVLGCHMFGPTSGEIIQALAVALECGATKACFDATLAIHPTVAEEFVTMRS
ncbi:MAG: glutathione-disulfide reductase [Myxococcales bacterium]|nr:glutathione-disulfide reductase [Myxococcales bacterium]